MAIIFLLSGFELGCCVYLGIKHGGLALRYNLDFGMLRLSCLPLK